MVLFGSIGGLGQGNRYRGLNVFSAPSSYKGVVASWDQSPVRNAVNKVPIGRYVAFVGSLLLAVLVIADWYLPMAPAQSVTSREAEPIIRIKSDRKWPERIVFDTSAPTIIPEKPAVVADAPVTNPPREALALLTQAPAVSKTPMPVRTERKVAKRAPRTGWAAYRPAARAEALPAGW